MTRPQPRRSALAADNPVTSAPNPTPPPPAPTPAESPTPPESPESLESHRSRRYPPKVTFYQHPDDTARVRGAILHTQITEGPRTMSQFIHQAVMAEVERLERVHNNGKPFPQIGPNILR